MEGKGNDKTMEKLRVIYWKLCPYSLREKIYSFRARLHLVKLPQECERKRFIKIQSGAYMESHREECSYMLKKGRASIFPYPWTEKYRPEAVTVYIDKKRRMPYVILVGGQKMYFPRSFSKTEAMSYFSWILMEQDRRSPHCYFDPADEKLRDSTFLDIGGAEGYITLIVLPYVREALIFECDSQWLEALDATFEPYRSRVRVIPKFAGGEDSADTVRVDSVAKGKENIVLKIDVEGMEKEVLSGAEETLGKPETKVYVCAYHKEHDEKELDRLLQEYGFRTSTTGGWMYFGDGDASFRRGIIRAWKE